MRSTEISTVGRRALQFQIAEGGGVLEQGDRDEINEAGSTNERFNIGQGWIKVKTK